jgi:hypothetical protein
MFIKLKQIGVEKMHKDTKYVLFLDDDVRLHPGTIGALTKEMEKNPEVCFFVNPLPSSIALAALTMYAFVPGRYLYKLDIPLTYLLAVWAAIAYMNTTWYEVI